MPIRDIVTRNAAKQFFENTTQESAACLDLTGLESISVTAAHELLVLAGQNGVKLTVSNESTVSQMFEIASKRQEKGNQDAYRETVKRV